MKKTATITWIKHNNYGTYLQAYALQQVIRQQGYDNDILDDSSIIEEGVQRQRFLCLKRIVSRMSIFFKYRKYFKVEKITGRAYLDFRNKYLKINDHIQPLSSLDRQYDIFICGSDQIWYPSMNIYSPYYYLAFTKKKKIAYAPSISVFHYPKEFIPKVQPLLSRFDHISVREEQGVKLLTSFLCKPVRAVADPTLLLEGSSWKVFVKKQAPVKGKYILCYFLTPNQWYMDLVREFASKAGLPIKIFCTQPGYLTWGDCVVAGPEEFLNYIYHSEYFFTDSFHGSIFSILFEKRFYTFKRFKDTAKINQNARVDHLFSLLGLRDYFIGREEVNKIKLLPPINYRTVNEKLISYREQSLSYLVNALKN